MARSKRFRALEKRLNELRKRLVPGKLSPTGQYSHRVYECMKGYRLLVHAEFETYFEDMARELMIRKIEEWKNGRHPSTVITCLVAAYHTGFDTGIPGTSPLPPTSRPKIKVSVDEAIDRARNQYMVTINDNHGIREPNLRQLLLPVGIGFDALDLNWLNELDAFGTLRGQVAHSPGTVTKPIDPKSELDLVARLVVGLAKVDQMFLDLA